MKKLPDPDPAGQKSPDPTGSGSSSLYLPGESGRTGLLRVRQPGAPWHRLPNLLPQDHGIMDQNISFIHIMHPSSLIQASGPIFDLREEEKTYPRKNVILIQPSTKRNGSGYEQKIVRNFIRQNNLIIREDHTTAGHHNIV